MKGRRDEDRSYVQNRPDTPHSERSGRKESPRTSTDRRMRLFIVYFIYFIFKTYVSLPSCITISCLLSLHHPSYFKGSTSSLTKSVQLLTLLILTERFKSSRLQSVNNRYCSRLHTGTRTHHQSTSRSSNVLSSSSLFGFMTSLTTTPMTLVTRNTCFCHTLLLVVTSTTLEVP